MSWMPSLLVADRLRQPAPTERRDWLSDDDWMFEGTATASGARVNRDSAMRLSTVWACVRLLTNTVLKVESYGKWWPIGFLRYLPSG